jgi:hypothetical protein
MGGNRCYLEAFVVPPRSVRWYWREDDLTSHDRRSVCHLVIEFVEYSPEHGHVQVFSELDFRNVPSLVNEGETVAVLIRINDPVLVVAPGTRGWEMGHDDLVQLLIC